VQDLIRVKGRTILPFVKQHASYIPDLRGKKIKKEAKRQNLRG
jgi:hypothetical protein